MVSTEEVQDLRLFRDVEEGWRETPENGGGTAVLYKFSNRLSCEPGGFTSERDAIVTCMAPSTGNFSAGQNLETRSFYAFKEKLIAKQEPSTDSTCRLPSRII